MINAINNVNFKAVYTPKSTSFSDSQQKVYDDIKNKLNNKKTNFLVESVENDSVKLSELIGVKETGTGLDKKYSYKRAIKIGRYNENCLFEMKDYKKYVKEQVNDLLGLLAFVGILILGLGFMYVTANKKPAVNQQVEKVTTMAKDSLQTLKQDSIKIFK
ncbi:hypothetical protein J6R97_04540 [bacterium]|nr:hypothetical protein [bacterium]